MSLVDHQGGVLPLRFEAFACCLVAHDVPAVGGRGEFLELFLVILAQRRRHHHVGVHALGRSDARERLSGSQAVIEQQTRRCFELLGDPLLVLLELDVRV